MFGIVITGAGSGLGRHLAIEYSHPQNTILLVGRSVTELSETKELIEQAGNNAIYYICDIREFISVQTLCENITSNYSVTTLINNAGVGCFGELETLSDLSIRQAIDTNIVGTISMTKYFLPYLKQMNNAKIINIISTAGLRGKQNESVYCATKFAIRGFTESLQKELEGTSVTVTGAYMGGMNTPFWNDSEHIKDKSRLTSATDVARQIRQEDDGRLEIHIP